MKSVQYTVPQETLDFLLNRFPNDGKSSHIGEIAIGVVKAYFESIDHTVKFEKGQNGADMCVISNGETKNYEIKGTQSSNLDFNKLKVSSKQCFEALRDGMEIIRVTNVRQNEVQLHFLKFGVDFDLIPEDRWSVKEKK